MYATSAGSGWGIREERHAITAAKGRSAPARVGARMALVRRSLHLLRRPARVKRYLTGHPRPRLHLGCGEQALEGWLNADLVPRHPSVVILDARRPFPLPDQSFEVVFSEHLIEHLTYEEGRHMLVEARRILMPGGVLRIATPDLRFLIDLYSPSQTPLQRRYVDWALGHASLTDPGGRREVAVINNFFRAWEHRFIYDFATLSALLRRSGFEQIEECEVGASRLPELCGLESHGKVIPEEFSRLETFVVEARKPDEGAWPRPGPAVA